jgi:hypothetical protein
MNFTQKSRLSLHTKVANGRWTPQILYAAHLAKTYSKQAVNNDSWRAAA